MLTASKNIDIRKESLYVICNSITGSDVINRSKIFEATNGQILDILIDACAINEQRLRMAVLDSIDEILSLDQYYGWHGTAQSILYLFEKFEGLDALD